MALGNQQSRKRPAVEQQRPTHANKRIKTNHERFSIRAQGSEKALNKNGELDVGAFIKAREFEIRALEENMAASKKTSSTRAFQQVPRDLRRRTASHNVKRVPKRLRARAAKEMKEDNTPTVEARKRQKSTRQQLRAQNAKLIPDLAKRIEKQKEKPIKQSKIDPLRKENELAAPKPTVMKHKKRQINKSWLPTHVWHAKRATMTAPLEPLWRFAIPLTPTEKTARVIGRSSRLRGCVAWDASYMSMISISGPAQSIVDTFRSLHVSESYLLGKTGEAWRAGSRSRSCWVAEKNDSNRLIAKVLLVWQLEQAEGKDCQVFVRVHPSAFFQLWQELLKVIDEQSPAPKLKDLRFEIGSIDIAGPAALEALTGILSPCEDDVQLNTIWPMLASIQDSYTIPKGALLSLLVSDPRLGQPHQTVSQHGMNHDAVLNLMTTWSPEATCSIAPLFDYSIRHKAVRSLPTQSAINKRKGEALAGHKPEPLPNDPQIPILVLANNHDTKTQNPGSWTIIMPWGCILPTWHCLIHYPLSGGGNPRFGGLEEQHQLCFENNTPWFPGDYPGTQAGWQWELDQQKKRKTTWDRKPKSRRVEWSTLDLGTNAKGEIGLGWACDWRYLCSLGEIGAKSTVADIDKRDDLPHDICQIISPTLDAPESFPQNGLTTISVTLVSRGVPAACARIYRLPTDSAMRGLWMRQIDKKEKKTSICSIPSSGIAAVPETPIQAGADNTLELQVYQHPPVPEKSDLVGFVTTGNFNLAQGKGTGIGCVVWTRVVSEAKKNKSGVLHGLCIVRDAGQRVGRLARWTTIS